MNPVKASIILCVYAVLLCLSMPGISFLKSSFLNSAAKEAAFEDAHGPVATHLATLAADINRKRIPIAKAIGGFQPIFRIRQVWHLYRDGPRTIRRLEVLVDGEIIYRTGDALLDWNKAVFRNRRIRPMAETFTIKPKAKNPKGLVRYIVRQAHEDFPEAAEIEVRATWGNRRQPGETHHRMVAAAPDWTLERER